MKIDTLVWLIFPLLIIVLGVVLRPRLKISKKVSRIAGIIVAAIIISLGIIWRLLNGGF